MVVYSGMVSVLSVLVLHVTNVLMTPRMTRMDPVMTRDRMGMNRLLPSSVWSCDVTSPEISFYLVKPFVMQICLIICDALP